MSERFDENPDIRAAADYADAIHRHDAVAGYASLKLSDTAVAELLQKGFLQPARLTDGSLTEAYLQRELSDATLREIQASRKRS